jgi:hypothetical protein
MLDLSLAKKESYTMHVDLINSDQTIMPWLWGGLVLVAVLAGIAILLRKNETARNWVLLVGAVVILLGFAGIIVTSTVSRETNRQRLTDAINTTYHLKLSARQETDLYAHGSVLATGVPAEGKYGTTTLERAHSFIDVSLYYQAGDFFLGTVGTGQVTPLPTS